MKLHFELFRQHTGRSIFRIIGFTFAGLTLALILASIFSAFVMLLWNWLMPDLFGLKTITYLQALGISILAKMIFGHMGHPPRHHRGPFGHFHRHGPAWWKDRSCREDSAGNCRLPSDNWSHYREYWKTRGKNDFEQFLKEHHLTDDRPREGH